MTADAQALHTEFLAVELALVDILKERAPVLLPAAEMIKNPLGSVIVARLTEKEWRLQLMAVRIVLHKLELEGSLGQNRVG